MTLTIFDKTNPEILISNLRGEIGDIIETWTLFRDLKLTCQMLSKNDIHLDAQNHELIKPKVLTKKLENDIVSSLSELAEKKYAQINFFFASDKLNCLKEDCIEFETYIITNNFRKSRHEFISHKKLPPTEQDITLQYRISYITIIKALAKAIMLMKKFDEIYLGSNYNVLWLATRKKRYNYTLSGKIKMLLLPYKKL